MLLVTVNVAVYCMFADQETVLLAVNSFPHSSVAVTPYVTFPPDVSVYVTVEFVFPAKAPPVQA